MPRLTIQAQKPNSHAYVSLPNCHLPEHNQRLAPKSVRKFGLGDGTGDGTLTNNSAVPVDVGTPDNPLGRKAIAVTAGRLHNCALLADGSVQCWGSNQFGKLGIGDDSGPELCGSTFACSPVPVDVVSLGGKVIDVAAGDDHTCVVLADGRVQCWGSNTSGQLGDGTTTNSNAPVDVVDLGGKVVAVGAGRSHTCAALADGRVQCWGSNNFGQLGNGTTDNSSVPVDVGTKANPLGGKAIAFALSTGSFSEYTCALLVNGSIACWGNNGSGQLGVGDTPIDTCQAPIGDPVACSLVPVTVGTEASPLGGKAIALAAGAAHTCAVFTDGGVQCWGLNDFGQLDNGTTVGSPVPVNVGTTGNPLGAKAIAVGAGNRHTCAVLADGGIECWGRSVSGQLGNGITNGPENCSIDFCSTVSVDVVGLPIELP